MKLHHLGLAVLAALIFTAGAVIAQVTLPNVVSVGTTDRIEVVVGGVPTTQSKFASASQINGVVGYSNGGAVSTAWTKTMGDSETNFFIQPAGTLATGTLTTSANPGDGQRNCFLSTQTQTAITWTANAGQALSNAPTAGVAMVPQCMQYSAATATWYRSP